MIKFFRKIRQNLLTEGKTTKYFKYAIGEIILVVIGILIALQINNWNENRNAKNKEKLLLKELNTEFKLNKIQFDSAQYYHNRAVKSAEYIISKFPIDIKTIDFDSLGLHSHYMRWYYTFNPSEGITNALSSSSSYDLISNNDLRKTLISWSDVLKDYQEEEILAVSNYKNHLKPYEKKHMAFGWNNYKNSFNDPRIDLSFLETLEFENYVRDRHFDLKEILGSETGELDLVLETINQIIELTETEIDD
ncbi:DUF6090 family protein [uncultured Croceitalea sp.]|uniref:DUF6090 family protein n=1 Tax=uncultured Croceitalea sp. TaxID=1798908 RepID=UPI003305F016